MSNTLLSLPVKMVRLGDIAHITYGKGLPVKDLSEAGYPVFGANGVIGFHSEYMYAEPQVLISCRGAASGTINMSPEKCFITNNSLVVSFDDEIVYSKALFYLLQAANKKDLITGSAQPQVTINNAIELKIPLFTYTTQKNIVTKIEELFSELDSGIASLKTAQEQLKIYRQALLKHAFEGKLTEQWRKDNPDKLETPEQLLARIQTERETRYQQQLDEWKQAVKDWEVKGKEGKKPSKPTLPKVSDLTIEPASKTIGELPYGWCWLKFSDVLQNSPQNGLYKPASDYGAGCQIIRIDGFYDGSVVNSENLKRLSVTKDDVEIYGLNVGELIVNRVNSIEYLGKSALIRKLEEPAVFESNIMRCSLVPSAISKEFVTLFLNSKLGRQELCKNAKHAVNQASINQTDVGNAFLPICSFEEQEVIAREIIGKTDSIDRTVAEIKQQLIKSETLRQSILKKAFSGQLVPQDPNDEPASELLARIKIEKTVEQAVKKTK